MNARKSRPNIGEIMDVIIMIMNDSIIRIKKHKTYAPYSIKIPEMQNKTLSVISSLESDYFTKDKEFFVRNSSDITPDIILLHPEKISVEDVQILSRKYKPVNPTMYNIIKAHADKYLPAEIIPDYQSTEYRSNILEEFINSIKPLYFNYIAKKNCSLQDFQHQAHSHKHRWLSKIID